MAAPGLSPPTEKISKILKCLTPEARGQKQVFSGAENKHPLPGFVHLAPQLVAAIRLEVPQSTIRAGCYMPARRGVPLSVGQSHFHQYSRVPQNLTAL